MLTCLKDHRRHKAGDTPGFGFLRIHFHKEKHMSKNKSIPPTHQRSLFDMFGSNSKTQEITNSQPKSEHTQNAHTESENIPHKQAHQIDTKDESYIENLAREIQKHNKLYNEGHPIISDDAYDRLVEYLREIAPDHPVLIELTTPAVNGTTKVQHKIPMLSLLKARKGEEFKNIATWLKEVERTQGNDILNTNNTNNSNTPVLNSNTPVLNTNTPVLNTNTPKASSGFETILPGYPKYRGTILGSPKIDGLACSIVYGQDGTIELASTRGNGNIGENITKNVLHIESIPKHIEAQNIEVRGEVYMPLTAFRAFDGEKISARNLAVGGLKQKDGRETARYHLRFFAYEVLGRDFDSDSEKYEFLTQLGFETISTRPFHYSPETPWSALITEIRAYCDKMAEQRDTWDFDADGLVFKVDDNALQKALGLTAHHPKSAIAYKFACDMGITTLRQVIWQVAKGGCLTPVAVFDEIELAGARVQRASLSNASQVEKMTRAPKGAPSHPDRATMSTWPAERLREGAQLAVSRRGDVIPHVEYIQEQDEYAPPIPIPDQCPSCGAKATRDGLFLRCSQPETCPATGQGLLENYINVVGMMGFGEKIIANLYDAGYLSTPADLYTLSIEQIAEAVQQDSSLDTSAILPNKLYDSIQKTRQMNLPTFLESLSIPSLGKVNSRKLADTYGSLDNILNASFEDMSKKMYKQLNDGKKKAKSYYSELQLRRPIVECLVEVINKYDFIHTTKILQQKISSISSSSPESSLNKIDCNKLYDAFKTLTNDFSEKNLSKFLLALAIPKMGEVNSTTLAKKFGSIDDLFNATLDDIIKALDYAEKTKVMLRTIFDGLIKRRPLIEALLKHVTVAENAQTSASNGPFASMSFLFTGSLTSMKREEAQARIEALGGKAAAGVSKTLSVLVSTTTQTTKWAKAEELNAHGAHIALWDEATFLQNLQQAEHALSLTKASPNNADTENTKISD